MTRKRLLVAAVVCTAVVSCGETVSITGDVSTGMVVSTDSFKLQLPAGWTVAGHASDDEVEEAVFRPPEGGRAHVKVRIVPAPATIDGLIAGWESRGATGMPSREGEIRRGETNGAPFVLVRYRSKTHIAEAGYYLAGPHGVIVVGVLSASAPRGQRESFAAVAASVEILP